ncbi:MAG: glycosyltransferase family 2 protein [Mariniphaga sp.]
MDISIIVPVYNVEPYLCRCLDSIFTQNFSGNFEVIAVEDGSTDKSLKILKEYEKKESRLKIIVHNGNRKLSVARRTGMDASTGDYIMHVDSDDWILPGTLELLFQKCKSSDADVIVFDYMKEDNSGLQSRKSNIRNELFTTDKLVVQKYFFDAPWNKIVKRHLIQNMIYGTIGINSVEDLIYSTEILLRSNSILLFDSMLYVYFANHTSITNTVNLKSLLDNQLIIYTELQKILSANNHSPDFERLLFAQREKNIYFLLMKNHLLKKDAKVPVDDFVNSLNLIFTPDDKNMLRLIKSARSKYFCIVQYFLSVGIISSIFTLQRKLFQMGCKRFSIKKSL